MSDRVINSVRESVYVWVCVYGCETELEKVKSNVKKDKRMERD